MDASATTGQDLTPEQVAARLAEGWQVIDIREPYEREAGHIGGTRHIELARLAAEVTTLDRERPVIFYCRVGNRSAMAVEAFRGSGFHAYHLAGGIEEWVREGRPIEPADGHVAEH
jgi:rhodanese-related sulfurtransferase